MQEVGERDFYIACLLVCAVAFNLEAVRRSTPGWMIGYRFCVSFSASIKPTAILFLLLLLVTCIELTKTERKVGKYIWWTLVSLSIPAIMVRGFLVHEHSLVAFFRLSRELLPLYAGLESSGYIQLVVWLFLVPNNLALFLLATAATLVILQPGVRRDWEERMLLAGLLLGAASFFIQRKGVHYHACPFLAFVYLWAGYVLVASLKRESICRPFAAVVLIAACIAFPFNAKVPTFPQDVLGMLQADLVNLEATQAPGQVQCMDVTEGCLEYSCG